MTGEKSKETRKDSEIKAGTPLKENSAMVEQAPKSLLENPTSCKERKPDFSNSQSRCNLFRVPSVRALCH